MFKFVPANKNGSIQTVLFGGIELGKIMTVPLPQKTLSFNIKRTTSRNNKIKMGWRILPSDRLNLRNVHAIHNSMEACGEIMKASLAPKRVAPPAELVTA